jgi:hypothetical protein
MVVCARMAEILAIGIDPAKHTGLALVQLDTETGEASLIDVWPIYGERMRSWMLRAMGAAHSLSFSTRHRTDIVCWYERPAPPRPGDPAWDPCPAATRAGALQMAMQISGVGIEHCDPVNASQWASIARVPSGKRDGGEHRIKEAATRVAGAAAALAQIEHCRIDCAEAILIALACARAEAQRRAGGTQVALPRP